MPQEMLIYISKAARPLTPNDVEQIAISSTEKNKKSNITGLMLQIGNFYVQVLEGQPWKLSSLLATIERDDRHVELRVIFREHTQSRLFPQWSMGYFNIEKYYHANHLDIRQLIRYTNEACTKNATSTHALIQVIKSIPAICFI